MGSELVAVFYADAVVGAGVMRGSCSHEASILRSDCRIMESGGWGVLICVKVFGIDQP